MELLPTRACEAGYGPGEVHASNLSSLPLLLCTFYALLFAYTGPCCG